MKRFESTGLLACIRVAKDAPAISHMLFADDSYIFCKASKTVDERVMTMLSIF